MDISNQEINVKTLVTGGIVLAVVTMLFVGIFGLRTVPEGNKGVLLEEGKAIGEVEPGWKWVIPIYQDVTTLSTRTETYTMSGTQSSQTIENNARSEDSISVKTQEGLNSQMDISIRYRMKEDQAQEVYSRLGGTEAILEKLIRPTAREEIRTAASTYDVTEIYSANRSDFRQSVEKDMQDDFEEYGFVVEKVQVRNVQLPDQVERAIETKESVTQEIGAKRKEIEKERLERERKIIEAEGEAEQNEILDRSLTEKVLTDRYIKALRSGDVKVAYIPIGDSGTPTFVENLNGQPANTTAQ
ncbi:hypothetical protein GLT90_00295 [Nanohaloarchaea archaeon H12]|nr:hypothetical protein [Nanohaloarchaea archaeon H12]